MDIEIVFQTLEHLIWKKLTHNPEFPPSFIVMTLNTKVKIYKHYIETMGYSYTGNYSFDKAKFRGLDVLISADLEDNEFKIG